MELTHASFFSGVGGLDLGLERAGWRTVSFSEIDPYASAVLAERWPGIPNLGDIVELTRSGDPRPADGHPESDAASRTAEHRRGRAGRHGAADTDIPTATLWSGGFPCQDLSVAGQRRGFADGTRSSLAFAFLDLVERHRPPALLIENVPGLLSSHGGRDFGRLLREVGELGYGWAYRILDGQYFGVPQRRRRVFVVAFDAGRSAGAELAAEVLSVGTRCDRHPPTGKQAGPRTSGVLADGARTTRTVQSAFGHHGWTLAQQDADGGYLQLGTPPNPGGVRTTDGLAGGLDNRRVVAPLIATGTTGGRSTDLNWPLAVNALDQRRGGVDDNEAQAGHIVEGRGMNEDEALLPIGLDSHRYRCCGNGVIAPVSEWIGHRLAAAVMA